MCPSRCPWSRAGVRNQRPTPGATCMFGTGRVRRKSAHMNDDRLDGGKPSRQASEQRELPVVRACGGIHICVCVCFVCAFVLFLLSSDSTNARRGVMATAVHTRCRNRRETQGIHVYIYLQSEGKRRDGTSLGIPLPPSLGRSVHCCHLLSHTHEEPRLYFLCQLPSPSLSGPPPPPDKLTYTVPLM